MINVTAFAFTGYPVTDMAASRAFYEGLLGLKSNVAFEHDGKHWIEYELGDSTLAITNMSDRWRPSADGPAIALEVADFEVAMADLRRAGITFMIEPMDSGVCRLAVVLDPAGNSLAIHQRKAAS